jgi:hypothetical protein
MSCTPLKDNRHFGRKYCLQLQVKKEPSKKPPSKQVAIKSFTGFFLGFLDPEGGGDIFLHNIV